ncbi:hypothetical protein [Streptosporangium sp. NPDC023615]|uniref:hypothetical protein n=1 Tax=Streptosporangium sp. NPDC023615 TaxID=3154794 RepID=UPI003413D59F
MLNELTQQGRIETVIWQVESTGPSHAPAFTAAARRPPARHARRPMSSHRPTTDT